MNIIENLFMPIPFYAFSMGLLNMTMIDIYEKSFDWKNLNAFDWRIGGKSLFFLIFFTIASFTLLIFIEY